MSLHIIWLKHNIIMSIIPKKINRKCCFRTWILSVIFLSVIRIHNISKSKCTNACLHSVFIVRKKFPIPMTSPTLMMLKWRYSSILRSTMSLSCKCITFGSRHKRIWLHQVRWHHQGYRHQIARLHDVIVKLYLSGIEWAIDTQI